jgi:hypothetical protein
MLSKKTGYGEFFMAGLLFHLALLEQPKNLLKKTFIGKIPINKFQVDYLIKQRLEAGKLLKETIKFLNKIAVSGTILKLGKTTTLTNAQLFQRGYQTTPSKAPTTLKTSENGKLQALD